MNEKKFVSSLNLIYELLKIATIVSIGSEKNCERERYNYNWRSNEYIIGENVSLGARDDGMIRRFYEAAFVEQFETMNVYENVRKVLLCEMCVKYCNYFINLSSLSSYFEEVAN